MKKTIVVLAGALLLAGCSATDATQKLPERTISLFDNQPTSAGPLSFTVEIASTPQEQEQGLMFRKTVMPGTMGMLFVFDAAQERSFWMKNTLFPLDILFFGADGKFVSWQQMQPCVKDPCPTYASNGQAQYALEVPAGFMHADDVIPYRLGLPLSR